MEESEEVPESEERKIPKLLLMLYVVLFLGGLWAFYAYWNGSHGWLDRGYWHKLQEAAGTTYPFKDDRL